MKRPMQIVITVIAVIFLIWFIAPTFYGVHNLGTVLGVLLCCALIFRFGFSGVYFHIKEWMLSRTVTMALMRIIQVGASVFLIYAVIVSGCMLVAMHHKPANGSTAIVLGAQVKPWGPSTLLWQRIYAAQEYLTDDPDAKAVLTGGQGDDEVMSEAQCMYENLIDLGISPDRLIQEDKATNTEQNIRHSLRLIEEYQLDTDIAVVTDSYHQLRARIILAKCGENGSVGAVNTKNTVIGLSVYPTYFVREWLAIPVELIKSYS